MKDKQQMLASILKTAQMGQAGIQTLLEQDMGRNIRSALRSQLKEYDAVEESALRIAREQHWTLPELSPAARFMAERMTRWKLMKEHSDSRIADMMIQGNTQGLIKGLRDIHSLPCQEGEIAELSRELLRREHDNIRQMENFL